LRDPKRSDVKKLARAVHARVMEPLQELIGDATKLLVSPDGELNLIPLEALVDAQNRYLVERYSFSYVTGRDLLRLRIARESKTAPVVVANPLFGEPQAASNSPASSSLALNRSRQKRVPRRDSMTGPDLSRVYFAPLTSTATEAQAIKALYPEAKIMSGADATETSLKQVAAPSILHIATHGFFLSDKPDSSREAPDSTRGVNATTKIENPLLRSGLALAEANLHTSTGDDGILTALEAAGLNLWGTKLVILSACDTGLGEIKNGEGVFGLRRAFVLAGTETLVMSLWQVSDYVTREIMTDYYKGLRQGLGRGDALRQVQLSMLKRNNRQHPFYWASFIQAGEWANLEGERSAMQKSPTGR